MRIKSEGHYVFENFVSSVWRCDVENGVAPECCVPSLLVIILALGFFSNVVWAEGGSAGNVVDVFAVCSGHSYHERDDNRTKIYTLGKVPENHIDGNGKFINGSVVKIIDGEIVVNVNGFPLNRMWQEWERYSKIRLGSDYKQVYCATGNVDYINKMKVRDYPESEWNFNYGDIAEREGASKLNSSAPKSDIVVSQPDQQSSQKERSSDHPVYESGKSVDYMKKANELDATRAERVAKAKATKEEACGSSSSKRTVQHPPFSPDGTREEAVSELNNSARACGGTLSNLQCRSLKILGNELWQCQAELSCPATERKCTGSRARAQ